MMRKKCCFGKGYRLLKFLFLVEKQFDLQFFRFLNNKIKNLSP